MFRSVRLPSGQSSWLTILCASIRTHGEGLITVHLRESNLLSFPVSCLKVGEEEIREVFTNTA